MWPFKGKGGIFMMKLNVNFCSNYFAKVHLWFWKNRVTLTLTNCFAIHLPLKDQILIHVTSFMDLPYIFHWFFQALDFLKTREEFWNQLQLGSSISVPAVDAKSKNQRSKKRWFGNVHKWCHNLGYIIIKLIFKDLTKKYGHFLKK